MAKCRIGHASGLPETVRCAHLQSEGGSAKVLGEHEIAYPDRIE